MKKESSEELSKLYLVTTKRFCAGLSVKNGYITKEGTAPCFQWAVKKHMTFINFRDFLKRKGDLINITQVKEI